MSEEESLKNPPSPEKFFSKHAEDYAKSDSHAHGSDLARLIELLEPRREDIALDVATGTGFTAIELAGKVRRVVATDITREMLAQAELLAKERGISNISFEKAEAGDLPYVDYTFDIVTTRRAAHHFHDVSKFLSEAMRVLNNSGRIGLVDMSPPEGTEEFFNKIERMRDSTHTRALTPSEWRSKVEEEGLRITHLEILDERVSFERWLYPVKMGGAEENEIRKEWSNTTLEIKELLNLEETSDQVKSWVKKRIVLIARKESS
jgi:ubiquinone/menaquinone biosynthesis C-methylase UbiE